MNLHSGKVRARHGLLDGSRDVEKLGVKCMIVAGFGLGVEGVANPLADRPK